MPKNVDRRNTAIKEDIDRLDGNIARLERNVVRLDQSTKAGFDGLEKSIRKFATKTELRRVEKVVRGEILKVEGRVENMEEGQKRVETTLNKISTQLDGFVGRVDNLMADNEVGANQLHELRKDVDNHEKRITQIESSTPL